MASEIAHRSMTGHAMGMISLLTFQYLLGEFTTAFIKFPESAKGQSAWEFASKQLPLLLHVIIGVVLFFGTLALLVRAFMQKDKAWMTSSIAATIAVIAAGIAGATFVPTQKDTYSFFMAIFFLFALFSYFWGLYYSKSA